MFVYVLTIVEIPINRACPGEIWHSLSPSALLFPKPFQCKTYPHTHTTHATHACIMCTLHTPHAHTTHTPFMSGGPKVQIPGLTRCLAIFHPITWGGTEGRRDPREGTLGGCFSLRHFMAQSSLLGVLGSVFLPISISTSKLAMNIIILTTHLEKYIGSQRFF